MGVVFTVLFAIGLIVMRRAADHVDLDPGCVLYGAIETVPLDTVAIWGLHVPRAALTIGAALLLDLLFVVLFYKELKISTFDPALATTLGINAKLMHYLLMTLVAVTTVAAFESVGSILVIAMLIVPAAAAHLLTDRLGWMLAISVLIGVLSAPLGHLGAIAAPAWLGFGDISTLSSGMMAVAAGAMFVAAMLLGPRHGVISKLLHRLLLSMRIVREDCLGLLYRLEEAGGDGSARAAQLRAATAGAAPVLGRWALRRLRRQGRIARRGEQYRLTDAGRNEARELVRSHRLWESYLDRHLALPPDHLHEPAHRLEHVTGPALQTRLAVGAGEPKSDPHGSPIPESDSPEARPAEARGHETKPRP
jgi:manganese/zinc/iron transport system permease protein